jgi:hypothetical protein
MDIFIADAADQNRDSPTPPKNYSALVIESFDEGLP